MTDKIQNNIKDNYTISINNFSSDNIKNHIPISNINTNLNSNLNSFSQENFLTKCSILPIAKNPKTIQVFIIFQNQFIQIKTTLFQV